MRQSGRDVLAVYPSVFAAWEGMPFVNMHTFHLSLKLLGHFQIDIVPLGIGQNKFIRVLLVSNQNRNAM